MPQPCHSHACKKGAPLKLDTLPRPGPCTTEAHVPALPLAYPQEWGPHKDRPTTTTIAPPPLQRRDVFQSYDRDRSGMLDARQTARLVADFAGAAATRAQTLYCQVGTTGRGGPLLTAEPCSM